MTPMLVDKGSPVGAADRPTEAIGGEGTLPIPPTLIAGVGYRNLRDLSAGNAIVDALLPLVWPDGVEVEDLSYGPMDVIFRLREARFARLIIVGAATGPLGLPGAITRRRWRYAPEPPAMIQARVAEAVTGVISLENLLVICAHFAALPPEVTVIAIAPGDDGWGDEFSPPVARSIARVVAELRAECGATTMHEEAAPGRVVE